MSCSKDMIASLNIAAYCAIRFFEAFKTFPDIIHDLMKYSRSYKNLPHIILCFSYLKMKNFKQQIVTWSRDEYYTCFKYYICTWLVLMCVFYFNLFEITSLKHLYNDMSMVAAGL